MPHASCPVPSLGRDRISVPFCLQPGDGGAEDPQGGSCDRGGVQVHVLPQGADPQGTVLAADPFGEASRVVLRV